MINTIIFDLGGVIIKNPLEKAFEYVSCKLGVSKEDFRKVYYKFKDDFQKGKISEKDFFRLACDTLNIKNLNFNNLWEEALEKAYTENKGIISFLNYLKNKDFKIIILSNAEVSMGKIIKKKNYSFLSQSIFSFNEGIRKPERKIFEITLKKLGAKPDELIFVDDQKENVEVANKLGIHGILFKNLEQLKKEISKVIKNS